MATVRELVTKIGFKFDDRGLKKADRGFKKLKKSADRLAKSSILLGKKLSTRLTLPLTLLGGAMLKAAVQAEDIQDKFKVVFEGIEKEANDTVKTLVDDFGQSRIEMQGLLASTGDLLIGFGFTRKAALELSEKVQQLAVDAKSFQGLQGGAARASEILTKALLGEKDSLIALGVKVFEEDVKKQVAIDRTKGLRFETDLQAKAMATWTLILKQSGNTLGNYALTSESAANQSDRFKNQLKDLSADLGSELLPLLVGFLKVMNPLIKSFGAMTDRQKKLTVGIAVLLGAIGPLVTLFGVLITVATAVAGVLSLPALAIVAIVAAVGALVAVIVQNWDTIKAFWKDAITDPVLFAKNALLGLLKLAAKFARFASGGAASLIPGLDRLADLELGSVSGGATAGSVAGPFGFPVPNQENSFSVKNNFVINAGTNASPTQIAGEVGKRQRRAWDVINRATLEVIKTGGG